MKINQIDSIIKELKYLELVDQHRFLRQVSICGPHQLQFKGKKIVNFSSNDYLGLSQHDSIKSAAKQAIQDSGVSVASSRLISGNLCLHEKLEEALASTKEKEASLIFSSGFMANIGLLSSLLGKGDFIFSDELNHASIVDACRLSQARTVVFKHKNLDHLETLLKDFKSSGRRLIVSDSVFSMDGDIADLPDLVMLSEKYECWLMLDEAHATGVLGSHGGGLVEHYKDLGQILPQKVPLLMGTLSKSLGSFGGFVASSKEIRDYLINKCRPFIFSTALPPSAVGAALASLNLIKHDDSLRKKLWDNVHHLSAELKKHGVISGLGQTPIFPVLFKTESQALKMSEELIGHGFFVVAIRPPAVPIGTSRLRITVTADHTSSQIEELVRILNKLQKKLVD